MFTIPVEEFLEEVKAELYCYEEIGDDKISFWEETFMQKLKSLKTVKIKNDEIILKDENDLFEIADGFYSAIINKEEEKYWQML
ncbi:MAG: hypothetical protein LBV08_07635 [Clostridiales bacterium]|jgi:hypothetical protein|nr:hypothetical protein [Clostridiales bacterium]